MCYVPRMNREHPSRPRANLPGLPARVLLSLILCAACVLPLPSALDGLSPGAARTAEAAIYGDDYVGSTTVTDRGLNITEAPVVDAEYGILVDEDGNVLWSRSADKRVAMASITKIMTAIVVIERADLDDEIEVSESAAAVGESSAGLRAGTTVTVRELLKGLLIHSGNDAAVALAEGVSGDVDSFVKLMNRKARKMGLSNTHFANPTGLDAENHYSSASDISVMSRYAMNKKIFKRIVSKSSAKVDLGYGTEKLKTTNALLACWDLCIGVKTGYTSNAGQCLASAATSEDGVTLYAVVLCSSDEIERFIDSYKLLDWGFEHYRSYDLATSTDVLVEAPLSGYVDRTVAAGVTDDVSAMVLDYNGDISVEVKLVDIADGVGVGDEVGTVIWRQNETVVASAPLVAKENVGAPMPWTAVYTAAARLLGVFTGDDGIAESVLYASGVEVEMGDDTAGQIMKASLESDIRAYVRNYE